MNLLNSISLNKLQELLSYQQDAPLLFNSGLFLVLFLLFLGIYQLLYKRKTLRIVYIICFSLFFYYKSSGFFFFLLIISTLVDFFLGNAIHKSQEKGKRLFLLVLSLIANLGMLAFFKYTNFFIDNINFFMDDPITKMDIFLPVGISFYTFQTMSYSIDLYRGKIEPAKNILDFGFFVTFFPQLVAGPIVRASEFLPQIRKDILVSREDIGRGFLLICGGLLKKAVISDYIGVNFVDRVFENPALYSGFENLMGVYAYALQIYCDFSGYSDIAIGIGLLLGFTLPINFNAPYKATSITDFWRRWHISLSTWLRDYLYISLGGNRKGKGRTYVNLLITMLLGGLWHGASWKFVIWGALHGGALAIEKFIKSVVKVRENFWTKAISIFFTFHFVCFCWIFFRASSFDSALQVINQIVFAYSPQVAMQWVLGYHWVLLAMLLGYVMHFIPENFEKKLEMHFTATPFFVKAFALAVVIWIIIQTMSSEVSPFIYFQF